MFHLSCNEACILQLRLLLIVRSKITVICRIPFTSLVRADRVIYFVFQSGSELHHAQDTEWQIALEYYPVANEQANPTLVKDWV